MLGTPLAVDASGEGRNDAERARVREKKIGVRVDQALERG
jgi:hypothetical protein